MSEYLVVGTVEVSTDVATSAVLQCHQFGQPLDDGGTPQQFPEEAAQVRLGEVHPGCLLLKIVRFCWRLPHRRCEIADLLKEKSGQDELMTNSPMSRAQMAMGGTNGNLDILPKRAITIGMYEMLKSRRFHLTFMRSWHAGLWRRALLGPVTPAFPGSLLQERPNVKVTLTEPAARPPMVDTAQATGEKP